MVDTFVGKSVVVTGAAKGLGRDVIEAFAERGAQCILSDIDVAQGESAAAELRSAGYDVRFIPADVTQRGEVERLLEGAVNLNEKIDIVVNAADIRVFGPTVSISEEHWRLKIEVAFKGVFLVCGGAARHMIRQSHGGRLINFSSTESTIPYPGSSAESAAKAGVDILTRVMACELGPYGITVNAVAPGLTANRENDPGFSRQYIDSAMRHTSMGRPAKPREVVDAVLFLASENASYINGHTLVVDGGYSAGIPALLGGTEPFPQWLGIERPEEGDENQ